MTNEKRHLITRDRDFYRTLITLAIPIVLQNLITFAVNFADNLMIGSLGDVAVSGVYMGNQFQTVLQMFTVGIDAAILIIAGQYWGIKDTKSVKLIGAMGIRWSVIVGGGLTVLLLIFPRFFVRCFTPDTAVIDAAEPYVRIVALSYVFFCASQMMVSTLRAVENAKIGFYVSCIALGINVLLNYLLIFGKLGLPALGITGAAIATLIARIIEFLITFFYAFRMDKKLNMKFADLFSKAPLLRKDFFQKGAPIVWAQLVWAVNMISYTAVMGQMDTGAVTAASVIGQLESFLRVFVFGLSAALGIVTSMTVGAGKFEKMKEYTTTAEVIFLIVGLLSAGVILLIENPFISLYSVSDDAIAYYHEFMTVLTFTFIGTCWQATCLAGLVKSGGDTAFVFKNDTIFVFLVVIPAAWITLKMGCAPWIVFAALKCDQILKCIVAFFKINSFNWMKKLTRTEENA